MTNARISILILIGLEIIIAIVSSIMIFNISYGHIGTPIVILLIFVNLVFLFFGTFKITEVYRPTLVTYEITKRQMWEVAFLLSLQPLTTSLVNIGISYGFVYFDMFTASIFLIGWVAVSAVVAISSEMHQYTSVLGVCWFVCNRAISIFKRYCAIQERKFLIKQYIENSKF